MGRGSGTTKVGSSRNPRGVKSASIYGRDGRVRSVGTNEAAETLVRNISNRKEAADVFNMAKTHLDMIDSQQKEKRAEFNRRIQDSIIKEEQRIRSLGRDELNNTVNPRFGIYSETSAYVRTHPSAETTRLIKERDKWDADFEKQKKPYLIAFSGATRKM